jgi:hypothetical protein
MKIPPVVYMHDLVNAYVLNMYDHQALDETMEGLVDFGAPVVAAVSTLLAATPIIAAQRITLATPIIIPEPFGRILQVTSTAAGTVILIGRDYLNQIITQQVTAIIGNVSTLKAFKQVDAILSGTLAGNVSIGPGTGMGLPFATSAIGMEYDDGVAVAAPTLTQPVQTDPATSLTGDPRGTVVPTGVLNGVRNIQMTCRFRQENAGGLYGVKGA